MATPCHTVLPFAFLTYLWPGQEFLDSGQLEGDRSEIYVQLGLTEKVNTIIFGRTGQKRNQTRRNGGHETLFQSPVWHGDATVPGQPPCGRLPLEWL
jgi:hypothetical protein